jgi:hypothetical protein
MSSNLLSILVILSTLLSLLLFIFINSFNGIRKPTFSSSLFKPILNLILFKSDKVLIHYYLIIYLLCPKRAYLFNLFSKRRLDCICLPCPRLCRVRGGKIPCEGTHEPIITKKLFDKCQEYRSFLEKIGLNFILQERRLIFQTEGTLRLYLSKAPYQNWRVVVDEKRTLSFDKLRTSQPPEMPLLIKLYRKRSMGWQISLGDPICTTLPYKKGVLSKRC